MNFVPFPSRIAILCLACGALHVMITSFPFCQAWLVKSGRKVSSQEGRWLLHAAMLDQLLLSNSRLVEKERGGSTFIQNEFFGRS